MLAVLAVVIGSCAPREPAPEPPAPTGPVHSVPDVLMENCLTGIDPHTHGVRASRREGRGGYELTLPRVHGLRYAGLEDGDFVYSVNGYPLGTAEAWYRARQGVEGQRRCVWEVERRGRAIVVAAERVDWPEPQPPQPQEDGTIRVSRSAIAVSLAHPSHLRNPSSDAPYTPASWPHLEAALATAGIPRGTSADVFEGQSLWSAKRLEAALFYLLTEDRLEFVVSDQQGSRTVTLVPVGPTLPPPPPSLAPGPVEADLRVLQDTLATWARGETGEHGRALLHRGPDGKPDGHRLSAIRRDTPLDLMGIKNGDIIQSIAGVSVSSREGLALAAHTIEGATRVELQLLRRGEPFTLVLEAHAP